MLRLAFFLDPCLLDCFESLTVAPEESTSTVFVVSTVVIEYRRDLLCDGSWVPQQQEGRQGLYVDVLASYLPRLGLVYATACVRAEE